MTGNATGIDASRCARKESIDGHQVHRIFGVEHIAEQLTWLQSQRWPERRLLPNGGWPIDAVKASLGGA